MPGKEQQEGEKSIMTEPLPRFRADLKLFRGPEEADGAPTYSLYDPVSVKYYQVSWEESLIFKYLKPGVTGAQLVAAIAKVSPVQITQRQLEQFFEDAKHQHLLDMPAKSEEIAVEAKRQSMSSLKWLLFHYLYFRIPLFNPNTFLEKTLRFVQPLVSRFALTTYAVLTVLGLFQLVGRFDEFIHTFPYFFSAQGVFVYALAITCTKVIHELSHAYTAKYYKVHVPAMGVAFLVMWPVLYTDVTDGWKLQQRKQRLAITFAGVASELILAGLATLAWALSGPGALQSVFFVVASASWISTLVVNLNPAMRFDGYYLLADLWGVDNLQSRSFAVARWKLRKVFLGLDVPPPERIITERRAWGMVAYSIYTWVYRLFLYTAIALLVYYKFTKVLGIFLFAVEVVVFFGWPIWSELKQLSMLRPFIKKNLRISMSTFGASLALFWFIVPLPHTESFVGVTVPQKQQVLYVPHNAIVEALHINRGDAINVGDALVTLRSPELENEIATTRVDREIVEKQIFILANAEDDEDRAFLPEKKAELAALDAKMQGLMKLHEQLVIRATVDGTVYDLEETLREGVSMSKDAVIGRVAPMDGMEIICFVPEDLVVSMEAGQEVAFHIHDTVDDVTGHVLRTNPTRASELLYPQLGSVNYGDLPVVEGPSGELIMMESFYAMRVRIDEQGEYPLRIGQSGSVEVEGPWRSRFIVFMRFVNSILIRESGF